MGLIIISLDIIMHFLSTRCCLLFRILDAYAQDIHLNIAKLNDTFYYYIKSEYAVGKIQ